jgi:hypothetical protein
MKNQTDQSRIYMKPTFDIVAEPRGQTYIDLLSFAASRCASFSLVWGDPFSFENSAYEIKHALKPFLLSNDRMSEWPGTILIGGHAIVRRYRITDESISLLHTAGGLYSWLQPKLPEDLAFYTAENAVWLASTSHEGEAWFIDESLRPAEIYAYVPKIKIKAHTG